MVLWLWGSRSGPSHKWDNFFLFDPSMLIRMAHAVRNNLRIPHRIVAITDLPKSVFPDWIEHVDLVEHFGDIRQLGGCWLRLKAFSPELKPVLGERVAWIDLDAVVTGDLTPLFDRPEDIVLYRSDSVTGQPWNGSLVLFSPERCRHVWQSYDPQAAHALTRERGYRGTDQAWLAYCYPDHATPHWTREDGVYYYNLGVGRILPPNARIVLFPGRNKPSDPVVRRRSPWLPELWPLAGEVADTPSWGVDGTQLKPLKRKRTLHDIRREYRALQKAGRV